MQDMSHQIRTPLNIVHGFSQVLRDESGIMSDEDKRQIAETMYVQTNTTVCCSELAREAFDRTGSLITHTAEMSLDCRVPDGLTVKTNRQHLLIVLTELLFNALHFTSEGRVVMRVETAGNDLLFTIEDTGPGIPPDKADFIFEKFTKIDMFTEGLGLGLFLCRRVVQLMGGSLTLDSEYTGGSRFVVKLSL